MSPPLTAKILAIHHALDDAALPHAFGGALALAWCTQRARGTIDVDVNVFTPVDRAAVVLAALSPPIAATDADVSLAEREGQVRVWWDRTPVDVFLNTTDFHDGVAARVRLAPFLGEMLPFLSCRDLAVFKAFFDRTKDWADLEEMAAAGSLDRAAIVGELVLRLGADDHRIDRLRAL
jgi:hypothetical protein